MKCYYKMFYRYLFSNKLLFKLKTNLCEKCLFRFVSTTIDDKLTKNTRKRKSKYERANGYLCIKDKNMAKKVAKYVTSDLPDNSVIFESCPGTGVLTKQLLKSNAESVRVFEDNRNHLNILKELQKSHPKRLQIIDNQILDYKKFLYKDLNQFEVNVDFWFRDIPIRDWRSVPAVRFVTVLSPKNTLFLRSIIHLLLKKELFFSYGRTEFFVFISETEYQYMAAKPETNYNTYRSSTILYNTLFDIQTLESVPYNSFELYTRSEDNIKTKKFKGNSKLIRLTPKLYLDEFNGQTLYDYYYFVCQTFMKRKNYIIPFLENWFPNCGPDLILKGIPVFKYFGDLKPEEVMDLFKYFHNRPDYQNSLYKMFVSEREESVDDSIKDTEDNEEDIELKDKIELNDNNLNEESFIK